MKNVAALSFNNNHSISMDVEDVSHIEVGEMIQVEDGAWTCELLIRSANGTVAIQMMGASPDNLRITQNF